MNQMNYDDACTALRTISKRGSILGLESVSHLCKQLGNPQDKLKTIHVAGTNGKGSTCVMISTILHTAGYKTGTYTSPYLTDYRDSFRINGEQIKKADFAHIFSLVYHKALRIEAEGFCATEFEILTACAFLWFERQGCDIAVIETGLGGRLDATNVIKTPLVSVLTAIALDHTAFLGETIEQIAQEKCGIIKPNGFTVCYPEQADAAMNVIRTNAAEQNNLFIMPQLSKLEDLKSNLEGADFQYNGMEYHVSLPGKHQIKNAITAIETIKALQAHHGFCISKSEILRGLGGANLQGRHEVLNRWPLIIFDGAHNLQGIMALADTIESHLKNRPVITVMGMLKDKQYEQSISVMAKFCRFFIAVSPDNPRALDAEDTAGVAKRFCKEVMVCADMNEAIQQAVLFCPPDGAVVVCGSLYMARDIKAAVRYNKDFILQKVANRPTC